MPTKDNVALDALDSPMYQIYQTIDGGLGASCAGGTEACSGRLLAVVDLESSVHDKTLAKLTRKINQLLAEVAKTRDDLDLELIHVGDQVLLAWTSPEKPPEGAREVQSVYEIKQMLGVRPRRSMQDPGE